MCRFIVSYLKNVCKHIYTIDSSGTDDEHDSSQPRVRRSKVWQFFEQDLVMVDDVWKAVCKYCGLRLGAQSGTSSLRSHIATTCPAIGDDDRNSFLATIKKKIFRYLCV